MKADLGLAARGSAASTGPVTPVPGPAASAPSVPAALVHPPPERIAHEAIKLSGMRRTIAARLITPILVDAANERLSRLAPEANDRAGRARVGQLRSQVIDGALGVAAVMTAMGSFDHRADDRAVGSRSSSARPGNGHIVRVRHD